MLSPAGIVSIKEGDIVKRGDLLTRIENSTLQTATAMEQYNYQIAKVSQIEGEMALDAANF